MPAKEKISVEKIKQLADDIRTINGFVENHGFDASLFNVTVTPQNSANRMDWPLIGLFLSVALCLALILTKVFGEFTGNVSVGLLIVSLVTAIAASMCAHLRFNNTGVSLIFAIGVVVIIAIGFGVLTPREAIEKVEQLVK